jgi:hypothetical protein
MKSPKVPKPKVPKPKVPKSSNQQSYISLAKKLSNLSPIIEDKMFEEIIKAYKAYKKANKYKYLKLQKLYVGSGRKWRDPEPDIYLYHGTSSYYIDSIQKNGLLTKYPEEFFKPIKKFWDIMHKDSSFIRVYIYKKGYNYIKQFIMRNDPDSETPSQISLTDDIKTAKEYAVGGRIIGEGPTFFYEMLNEYLGYLDINGFNNEALLNEMKELKTKLNDAINSLIYPPLILAINMKDIPESEKKQTEYVIYESINANKLFIYKEGNKTYTPLLSEQGNSYVVEIKRLIELNKSINTKNREKQEKLQREEEEKQQLKQY